MCGYSWGKPEQFSALDVVFVRLLSQLEHLIPGGAAGLSPVSPARRDTYSGHILHPICHIPPGSLQHNGSAVHRTLGSGYRPPASSLQGL